MRVVIGQKDIQQKLYADISQNTLPRFIILVGAKGSGRQTISERVAEKLDAQLIVSDGTTANIKDIIQQSYDIVRPTVYLIPNAGALRVASQNALLKVTEEPPNNAYWIFTVENREQILPTLISRGFVYSMDIYTESELREYVEYAHPDINDTNVINILLSICETPGDIDLMLSQGVVEFKTYIDKVIDNIAVVSGANSFKIGNKLAFKGESDKYDLRLFLKAFMSECFVRLQSDVKKNDTNENTLNYALGVSITSKYLQELQVPSLNKSSLFDMWLLDIRQNWM